MRKLQLVLAVALLVGTTSMAVAQDAQPQGERPGRGNRMAALLQGITLTADQQTKVDEIAKKYADARQAMMQDESVDQETRRGKMREAMTKQSDEIKAVLSDEQKKVFEKNLADQQARRQQGGGRPPR